MSRLRRAAAATAVLLAGALLGVPPAAAVGPPAQDHPYQRTQQPCATASTLYASGVKNGVSWGQQQLNYTSAWPYATGKGVRVGVIDTGVSTRPAAFSGNTRLINGGDYVAPGGNGLDDCDGHGTLVAGIIAASADPATGFAGVAPDATVFSIRQTSELYAYQVQAGSASAQTITAGDLTTLAEAIEWAVQNGVQVINVSEANCSTPGTDPPGADALRAAVAYAVAKGVVIVAAAGNLATDGACSQQNVPGGAQRTIPLPASLKGVLAVGAVDVNGQPASFTLAGPWVGVAAPGTQIVSCNPVGTGQVNTTTSSQGTSGSIQGTSFAAPYVAGLAALIRQAHPDLTPAQVIARIEATAEHPAGTGQRNDYVGYGLIDPVAAVTAELPGETTGGTPAVHPTAPAALAPYTPAPDPLRKGRIVGLIGTGGIATLLVAGLVTSAVRRRRRRLRAAAARPAVRAGSVHVTAEVLRQDVGARVTPVGGGGHRAIER